jgi:dienelactone hydrolase
MNGTTANFGTLAGGAKLPARETAERYAMSVTSSKKGHSEVHTRRWDDQRWLLDNVIWANGIDWDQPRSQYLNAPCGVEANADFAIIRDGVKKFADIAPAFEATARRREAKAREAEQEGHTVTARDNFFMAAIHWGAAMWPHHVVCDESVALNARKRECYTRYAALADHKVEAVWIPFGDKQLAGWFHLPPGYAGGQVPLLISMPGLDTFKEIFVSLNGDRWLSRGVAVLSVDGPGQAESRLLGTTVSVPNFIAAGKSIVDYAVRRPEVDTGRIGIFGNSFGSFTTTLITANEPRIRACATSATCLEPGFYTLLETASPTYKQRMMYMTGFFDEHEFDDFAKTLTWEGQVQKISVPYLTVAGEAEELSPLAHAETMLRQMSCPRRMVVYQGSRHAVGFVPAANIGPHPPTLVADWMLDRLNGKPMASERWYIQSSGAILKTPI